MFKLILYGLFIVGFIYIIKKIYPLIKLLYLKGKDLFSKIKGFLISKDYKK